MIPFKWQQLFIQEENVIILCMAQKSSTIGNFIVKSYRQLRVFSTQENAAQNVNKWVKMLTLMAKMNRLAWPLYDLPTQQVKPSFTNCQPRG